MRLIDADKIKNQMFQGGYNGKWTKDEILEVIDNQPTVYDVDKVVERLEEEKHLVCLCGDDLEYYQSALSDAIEIVKGGGKDE